MVGEGCRCTAVLIQPIIRTVRHRCANPAGISGYVTRVERPAAARESWSSSGASATPTPGFRGSLPDGPGRTGRRAGSARSGPHSRTRARSGAETCGRRPGPGQPNAEPGRPGTTGWGWGAAAYAVGSGRCSQPFRPRQAAWKDPDSWELGRRSPAAGCTPPGRDADGGA